MKIKVIDKSFDEVMALKKEKRVKPHKPDIFFRTLMKVVAAPDLKKSHFTFEKEGMVSPRSFL